ncbi:MAG TPA: hypothetical protein VNF24_03165 [Candidatus Acidoferrales bacterium]|nr:hypothetical protein [Candidatus Acidoferrales bacterium]
MPFTLIWLGLLVVGAGFLWWRWGFYFYDQLIMLPAGCPPLPQVRNPRPGPHPLSLLRLLVHFPTSLNQLCHVPRLRPQTVVPLTPDPPPTRLHVDTTGSRLMARFHFPEAAFPRF